MQDNRETKKVPSTINCGECRRRKQRCNREWPCNRCRGRNVPHLCHFESTTIVRAQVGRGDRSRCKPGHDVGLQRYFMDKLIQHYLAHVNHHYCILHPQQFLEEYAQWWEDRENQNLLSVESSCLILRVCALATLTLSPETKKEIEAGSNHPIEVLSERLHEQAQELKTIILSEKGGLIHVQQLMLSVQWFWSKSQPDKAWDSLAEAIKEAQDQGLHLENRLQDLDEAGKEARRRVWYILCIWDWHSSVLFDRPLIIDYRTCTIAAPTRKHKADRTSTPSPFECMNLQGELACTIFQRCGHIATPPLLVDHATAVEIQVRSWLSRLPASYSMSSSSSQSDTDTDAKHSWLRPQRVFLHTLAYVIIMTVLRPNIVKAASCQSPEEALASKQGLETAIGLVRMVRGVLTGGAGCLVPDNMEHNFLSFAVSRTASILCEAVMNDADRSLPCRPEVLDCIGSAMHVLRQLSSSEVSPSIVTTQETLQELVTQLYFYLHPEEKATIARGQDVDGSSLVSSVRQEPPFCETFNTLSPVWPQPDVQLQPGFGPSIGTNGNGAGPALGPHPHLGSLALQVVPPLQPTDLCQSGETIESAVPGQPQGLSSYESSFSPEASHVSSWSPDSQASWPPLFESHEYLAVQGCISNLSLQ